MTKEEQVKQIISEYLYTRDDILDSNEVERIAADLTMKLVVL